MNFKIKTKHLFFFACIICIQFYASAQQWDKINGVIINKQTGVRLAGVSVIDLQKNSLGKTNELGIFSMNVLTGDTLLFQKAGYGDQRFVITGETDVVIYLQKAIDLQQVTIKGQGKVQELNGIVNNYREKGLYFDGRPTFWQMFNPWGGAPITGFYELLGKDAANERRFIKFTKDQADAMETDRRYNKQLVKQVTALPDSDVSKFMQRYTPTLKDLNQWNDYQLIRYIRKSLKEFQNERDEIKLRVLE